ncbi:VOC family protein [Paractinoplanes globisporus]|uniref:VOC family protein n=1 Tax=Paractinoplanes globisporus TaxID=113565 RepID=A0ABW6WMK1_9ACTN|nr:VOC family protein [Actinoplanes globisporus]
MAIVRTDPGLLLRPIVHVRDLPASIAFYERLGAELIHGDRETGWVLLQLGTVQIVLTARGEPGIELHFEADMPLEQLERRLHRAGYPVAEVATDRDFGEQLRVRTPDGFDITISRWE